MKILNRFFNRMILLSTLALSFGLLPSHHAWAQG